MTQLHREITACRVCASSLGHDPRPIVQFAADARLLIIGQAPGSKVHASGVPWDDPSGDRLREWTGLDKDAFYDLGTVALMPMGFCYPGKGTSGDLPPRPECAPLWHRRVLAELPELRMTLLVGSHAQKAYLPKGAAQPMTETVMEYARFLPDFMPLPHPSWRSTGWMRANPWFEANVVPALRDAVQLAIAG